MVKAALGLLLLLAGKSLSYAGQYGGLPSAVASVPASAVVLARAQTAHVPLPVLAQAITAASSVAESVKAMENLGLLKAGEVNVSDPDQAMAMRHVLQAVWREAAPTKEAPEVDASWAVPAVVVRAPETTYYLHGVSHGLSGGLGRRSAQALESQVGEKGGVLLVEQSLPAAFGLSKVREVVDRPEDRAPSLVTRVLSRLMPFGRRFHRFYFNFLARLAEKQGNGDLAAHLKAVASRVYGNRIVPAEIFGLDLPLPLKEEVEPEVVSRSKALAEAALKAAAASSVVHVLSGWSHVPDIAALLGPKQGA